MVVLYERTVQAAYWLVRGSPFRYLHRIEHISTLLVIPCSTIQCEWSFINIKISSNVRYYNVIPRVRRTARTLEVTTTKQHFTKKSKISNFKIPVLRIIRYSFSYFSTRPGTDLLSLYFSNCLTFLISFNNAIRSAVQLDRFETAIVKKCSERKYIAFVTTNEKFSWSLVYGRGGQGISE